MLQTNTIIEEQIAGVKPKPGKTGIDWYIFCNFISEFKKATMEIGVGHGGSALSMSAYSEQTYLVDDWQQTWSKKDCEKIIPNAVFIDQDSKKLVFDTEIELIHVDAHKDFDGTINDLRVGENLNAKIIIVDDFMQSFWPNVTKAVYDFIDKSKYELIFIGNHQAILAKNKNSTTYKNIITNFPVVFTNEVAHFSYGSFPKIELLDRMKEASNLTYTWSGQSEQSVVSKKNKLL